jgi:phenylalanyl-tRNA synthetase beta chain
VPLGPEEIARLVEPIGFKVMEEVGAGRAGASYGSELAGDRVTVLVPTNRPDVRPEPFGVDDVIEEIARVFGYSNIPRRVPTWPQPGGITSLQRARRFVKDVLCGLGVSEGWTDTFVSEAAHRDVGLHGPAVRVSNPLDAEKPFLRRSLMPGLLSALAYNADRRQAGVRLFEVGVVFSHPNEGAPRVVERAGAGGTEMAALPGERELLAAVFAQEEDDARHAVASWHVLADAFRLERVRLVPPGTDGLPALPGLHPTRSAHLVAPGLADALGLADDGADGSDGVRIGSVGEVDPDVATTFGLTRPTGSAGGTAPRRIGSLEVDLGLLFDETQVLRRMTVGGAVSRYPSSDIDLAFVVEDVHPADAVAEALREAAGDLLESVRLFDVYRGLGIPEGTRSLAFRLRFVSPLRTLTDEEVGDLRARCIEEVAQRFGAVLR